MAAAPDLRERPAIHVASLGAGDAGLYRWIAIGAEEEGVPTALVPPEGARDAGEGDAVAAAYAAARSSRVGIGLAIAAGEVVLHEGHMPPRQPVLALAFGTDAATVCRRAGANAARLVARLPLKFGDEPDDGADADADDAPQRRAPAGAARNRGNQGNQARRGDGQDPPDPAAHPLRHPPGHPLSEHEVATIARVVAAIIRQRGITWR